MVKIKPVVCEGVTSLAGSDNISSLRITRSKRPRIPSDRWYSRGVTGDFILHGYIVLPMHGQSKLLRRVEHLNEIDRPRVIFNRSKQVSRPIFTRQSILFQVLV